MIKYTFPALIKHVGRVSQDTVSVTLLLILGTEETGLEVAFAFAGTLILGGEVLAGVGGELLSFGGEVLAGVDGELL